MLQIAIDRIDGGGGVGGRDLGDVLEVLARIPGRHKTVISLSEGAGFAWSELIDYEGGGGVNDVAGTRRASGGYGVTLAMPMAEVPLAGTYFAW